MEDGAAQGALCSHTRKFSRVLKEARNSNTTSYTYKSCKAAALRFASNAGKAIGHTGQESSHRIKPVQIKKAKQATTSRRTPRNTETAMKRVSYMSS